MEPGKRKMKRDGLRKMIWNQKDFALNPKMKNMFSDSCFGIPIPSDGAVNGF
jgi:hypothetical protein